MDLVPLLGGGEREEDYSLKQLKFSDRDILVIE